MHIVKKVAVSLLVAGLAFLAAFILAINFYTTWKAIAHEPAARSAAFFWGFLSAGLVSAAAFGLTLFLISRAKPPVNGQNRNWRRSGA